MRAATAAALLAVVGAAALAQQGPEAATAPGAVLRVLDKTDGAVTDLRLRQGEAASTGSISVALAECRYPTENPSGDAFAHVAVTYRDAATPVFDGWMIASAPALNALDHPRYDVWVLRCTTE